MRHCWIVFMNACMDFFRYFEPNLGKFIYMHLISLSKQLIFLHSLVKTRGLKLILTQFFTNITGYFPWNIKCDICLGRDLWSLASANITFDILRKISSDICDKMWYLLYYFFYTFQQNSTFLSIWLKNWEYQKLWNITFDILNLLTMNIKSDIS